MTDRSCSLGNSAYRGLPQRIARTGRCALRAVLWVAALSLVQARGVAAFESEEHVWISNRGLCVAFEELYRRAQVDLDRPDAVGQCHAPTTDTWKGKCDGIGPAFCDRLRRTREICRCEVGSSKSQVALCALYSVLAEAGGGVTYGDIVAYADYVARPQSAVRTARQGRSRIDDFEVMRHRDSNLDGLAELVLNPQHFRRAALQEFHSWHDHAVLLAQQGDSDSIYDALVYSAYADHFLEDFFAPGHMTEDEMGRSQIETNRVHDRDNEIGRAFEVDTEFFEELAASMPIDQHLATCLGNVETAESLRRPEEKRGAESRGRWAIDNLLPQPGSAQPVVIHLRGDGYLYAKRDGTDVVYDTEQTSLMVLSVARSILDVVDTFQNAERADRINHFPQRECQGVERDGCYLVQDDRGLIAAGSYQSNDLSLWSRQRPFPIIAFSVDIERLNESSRKSIRLEPVFTITPQGDWWNREHFGLEAAPGYTYVMGNDYDAHGPDVSVYLRLKRFHFFTAVDGGYRFFSGQGRHADRANVGGRLGFGVGPIWLYFGVVNDASLEKDGLDVDPLVFKFGVQTLGLPNLLWRYRPSCR